MQFYFNLPQKQNTVKTLCISISKSGLHAAIVLFSNMQKLYESGDTKSSDEIRTSLEWKKWERNATKEDKE